ncbi:MAG: glycosyltransferase family 39 protein [Chloroflexi bacterium]|nr:glycosyltransferase family 39 protein [Chloroflexota bacterium]
MAAETAERVAVAEPVASAGRGVWLRVGLAAALLLGAVLRLWRLDLTVFERDEGAIVRLAEDLVRLGQVPLSGPYFSQGVPSAPHFMYLIAPIVAVSRDPAFISGAIALANLAGVGAMAWLGWRAFGPTAAITATVLYAVSPWAVFYARRIWQPDILAPMAALLFVALDLAVIDRRAWWGAATFPLAVLAVLVHPSFATLLPFLVVPFVVLVARRHWWQLLVGLALSVVLTVPTIIHEVQTHWVDYANMRYYSSLHSAVDLQSVQYLLVLAAGLPAPSAEVTTPPFDHVMPGALVDAGAALEAAFLAGAILLAGMLTLRARGAKRWRLIGLLLWLGLPVVLTLRHSLDLHTHYFLVSYPAVFLVMGVAAAWLFEHGGQVVRWLIAASVVCLGLLQSLEITRGLDVAAANYDACYGRPLASEESLEREIVDFGNGFGATRAALEFTTDDALPRGYLARAQFGEIDVAGVGAFALGSPAGVPGLVDVNPPTLTQSRQPDLRYPDGIRLVQAAYSPTPRREQRVSLALGWTVDGAAASLHPHVWDIALVDATGQVVYHKSGVDHVPAELGGQSVVSWFTIDPYLENGRFVGPGPYQIQVRMQDAWQYSMLDATDQSGNAVKVLSIGPLQIGAPIRCESN